MLRVLILVLPLSACQLEFDKPGVPPGGGQGDLRDCQIEAAQEIPASPRVANYGAGLRSYDANTNVRNSYLIRCMEQKGYTLR